MCGQILRLHKRAALHCCTLSAHYLHIICTLSAHCVSWRILYYIAPHCLWSEPMILESTSVNTYINELQPENIKFISLYLATPEVTTHLSHTIRNYTSISSIEYIHRNNQIAVIAKPLVMDITCRTQTVTGAASQAPPSCHILTSAEFGNLPAVICCLYVFSLVCTTLCTTSERIAALAPAFPRMELRRNS